MSTPRPPQDIHLLADIQTAEQHVRSAKAAAASAHASASTWGATGHMALYQRVVDSLQEAEEFCEHAAGILADGNEHTGPLEKDDEIKITHVEWTKDASITRAVSNMEPTAVKKHEPHEYDAFLEVIVSAESRQTGRDRWRWEGQGTPPEWFLTAVDKAIAGLLPYRTKPPLTEEC